MFTLISRFKFIVIKVLLNVSWDRVLKKSVREKLLFALKLALVALGAHVDLVPISYCFGPDQLLRQNSFDFTCGNLSLVHHNHWFILAVKSHCHVIWHSWFIKPIFLKRCNLDVQVAILVVKTLDMLIKLVFASFMSTLQNMAFSLVWVKMVSSWRSHASEGLLNDCWVIVWIWHAIEVGGLALAFLVLLLMLKDLSCYSVTIFFRLLSQSHQERPQCLVFFENVLVKLVEEILVVLSLVYEFLLGTSVVVGKVNVVKLELYFLWLTAHWVEFGFHEIFVDLLFFLRGAQVSIVWRATAEFVWIIWLSKNRFGLFLLTSLSWDIVALNIAHLNRVLIECVIDPSTLFIFQSL